MTAGGDDDGRPARERLRSVPTLVWIMLGVLLIGAFVFALVFVFDAPSSWKSARSLGPPGPLPAPASEGAPGAPASVGPPAEGR